jgi:hypothetical protein
MGSYVLEPLDVDTWVRGSRLRLPESEGQEELCDAQGRALSGLPNA